jgi:hypothetical protein
VNAIWWRDRATGMLEHGSLVGDGTPAPALRGIVLPQDEPIEISYRVDCDGRWHTRRVQVGVVDTETGSDRLVEFTADGNGRWILHGESRPDLADCVDVDLGFSPITNTLPIRRLRLEVGEVADIRVAWVLWPSLMVRASDQRYERLSDNRYRFSAGDYSAVLVVGPEGLVRDYEGLWEAVEPTT